MLPRPAALTPVRAAGAAISVPDISRRPCRLRPQLDVSCFVANEACLMAPPTPVNKIVDQLTLTLMLAARNFDAAWLEIGGNYPMAVAARARERSLHRAGA